MKTNETGAPLPAIYFHSLYDPTIHDGEVEGPYPVWCDISGSVEHVGEEGDTQILLPDGSVWGNSRPPEFYSVYLHCRAGGTDCVADCTTLEQATQAMHMIEASITYQKGFE